MLFLYCMLPTVAIVAVAWELQHRVMGRLVHRITDLLPSRKVKHARAVYTDEVLTDNPMGYFPLS